MTNGITLGDPRLPARFWAKIKLDDRSGCWLWTATIHRNGYGQVWHRDGMKQAHRVVYAELVAPIPKSRQLDHRCRTRSCVNPSHLAPVTNKENSENRSSVNRFGNPRGVQCDEGKWFGKVTHNGRTHYTGYHDKRDDAAREVVALRNELFTNNLEDRKVTG